jgi:hypothetical protein
MKGADVVMGYSVPGSMSCVRSMTVTGNVGMPVDATTMPLSSTGVSYANGITTVTFTSASRSSRSRCLPTQLG